MTLFSRSEILARFRAKVAAGQPIVGGGAGTGISAKCEEAAGIDLIVVYNSGRYRMAGRGSLAGLMPYGNAHQLNLLTTPYAFDPEQARLLTEAGADVIVAHMGLTTSGTIGARTAKSLDDCVRAVGEIAAAAKKARSDVIVLC